MFKLAEKYGGHAAEEYPMLFQRILQNTIRDYYRRQKVRSTWTTLLSSLVSQHDDGDHDPLDSLQSNNPDSQPLPPDASLQQSQLIAMIEEALMDLPKRQREAFLPGTSAKARRSVKTACGSTAFRSRRRAER